jgi:hypothetical protein
MDDQGSEPGEGKIGEPFFYCAGVAGQADIQGLKLIRSELFRGYFVRGSSVIMPGGAIVPCGLPFPTADEQDGIVMRPAGKIGER